MKNTIDFLKIKDGELGAINFNNMIPVKRANYTLVDLNKKYVETDKIKYQKLLLEQLNWLNTHYYQVKNKSIKLYEMYNNERLSENVRNRCCNFKLLEEKCLEYNQKNKR